MRKVFFALLLLSGLSCTWHSKPSTNVLVIAVDQLGFNRLPCATENTEANSRNGFDLLCQDSVRFTHAYTTSLLSGPALASVLTGLYPIDHGLRDNGANALSSSMKTVAEMAIDQGYQTSFYSGGAPILRKLNLQQGFENFEDNILPLPARTFRPFAKTEALFESWLKENPHAPFFTFFYVPDLAFTNYQTQNELGENRNLTFESQLEALNQNLGQLIKTLKQQKRWESTFVVLMGLNATAVNHRNHALTNLNLFSERTQVTLLIKPPLKPRDQGIHWTYDDNVSLADVGVTLARFLNHSVPPNPQFPTQALNQSLFEPSSRRSSSGHGRPLLIESAWGAWHGLGRIRYAIRQDQFLYFYDEKPRIYNSLIDRSELTPLSLDDSNARILGAQLHEKMRQLQALPFQPLPEKDFLKWAGLEEVYSLSDLGENHDDLLSRLAHHWPEDTELSQQYALQLLRQQNWKDLRQWAEKTKDKDLRWLAELNTKDERNKGEGRFRNACLSVLMKSSPSSADQKNCSDPLSSSFNDWILSEENPRAEENIRDARKKKFLRAYEYFLLDRKVAEQDWAFQGVWDVNPQLTPLLHTIDLQMALPKLQKFKSQWTKNYNFIREESNQ
jgi:arylsulfatase A-like enzyme